VARPDGHRLIGCVRAALSRACKAEGQQTEDSHPDDNPAREGRPAWSWPRVSKKHLIVGEAVHLFERIAERTFPVKLWRTKVCLCHPCLLGFARGSASPEQTTKQTRKQNLSEQQLTDRQARILDFIRQVTRGRSYPPSVREIGEA